MTEQHHLKRLDRTLACRGEIVDLYKDRVELPDGRIEEWDYVHHKKGGGACIVPVLPDGRILMIRQYRPAIDEVILELPAGGRDNPGENTRTTARRELKEETGWTADDFIFLCRLQTAVAWCNEFTDVYLAEPVRRVGSQQLDEAEEICLECYTLEELVARIESGEIRDAKTVAGILAYAVKRNAGMPADKRKGTMT